MIRGVQSYWCGFVLALALAARAQGTFQNLGFESASLIPIPGDIFQRVEFDNAFPGWVGYVGSVQQTRALYNLTFLDSSGITIFDSGFVGGGLVFPAQVFEGSFTAILQAGVTGVNNTPADTTLSQTSLVPVNSQSLRFRAAAPSAVIPLFVFLNGERLSLVRLGSTPTYTLLGADIRSWQGQAAQLDFTVPAQRPHVINNYVFLDSIEFSSEAIPEPGVLGLLGLGAVFLYWRRHKRSPL